MGYQRGKEKEKKKEEGVGERRRGREIMMSEGDYGGSLGVLGVTGV